MRGTKISVLGLYYANADLFSEMQIPSQLSLQTLRENLLVECSDLEVIYPDADFMQSAIKIWSAKMIHNWQLQADTLYTAYDPFINLKRDEYRTITETHDLAAGNTQTNNVNAWDDSSATGVTRNIVTDAATDTGTLTTEEEYHMTGDSAIKDAQDVARAEIKLRNDLEMYNIIIQDFKKQFCLLVY